MEQTPGKPRILQLYLDNASWGGPLCGAEARQAAQAVGRAGRMAVQRHGRRRTPQMGCGGNSRNRPRAARHAAQVGGDCPYRAASLKRRKRAGIR
ncbi:MAG: hypothetical protein ACRYGA_14520 [Janthinobacterium lividum]